MSSCWDVPCIFDEAIMRGYAHLPENILKEWATLEADLSSRYANGVIKGVSSTKKGESRKQSMLNRIDGAIEERGSEEIKEQYHNSLRSMFVERLEDPGLMHNFEYFDVPSSDYMLMFYISTWAGRMADTMIYLHNKGWDLKGRFGDVLDDDAWAQMSNYEAMNISERKKAQSIVNWVDEFFESSRPQSHINITAFGGGNLPERFYCGTNRCSGFWIGNPSKMPVDVKITVFDDGTVRNVKELFPNDSDKVRYITDDLFSAARHIELHNTQDLVWMHGVSMYLGPLVPEALLSGFLILRPSAVMKYDYLLMTESMRRVLMTQGWPKGRDQMYIYDTPDAAIAQARADVKQANYRLGGKAYFDIDNIDINLIEPWGPTCVCVSLRKFV